MGKNSGKIDRAYTEFYGPHVNMGSGSFASNLPAQRLTMHERMYYRILTELTVNRFKWNNLPDSVDERFLELTLFRSGGILFWRFENPDFAERFIVSQFTTAGQVNHYDNPTTFRPVATGLFTTENLRPSQAVPIWNNYLRAPDMDIVLLYATKLAQIDTTIEINVGNSRHNKVLAVDETMRLSAENMIRQSAEGVPVIYVNRQTFDSMELSSLDVGPHHETIPNLLAAKGKMYNECLTLLGVSVVNQDKKERMITQEVESSADQAMVTRNIALHSRRVAAEQINTMFGLDISVEWMSDEEGHSAVLAMDEDPVHEVEEVEGNGNVHDHSE